MKKTVLSFLVICIAITTMQAQNEPVNPFEEFGYKPKIATLSKGKYVEFYDQDTIVQIGGAVFNTVTMKIMGFVEYDTIRNEYNISPEVISRWLSPDPLTSEFPSWSPYNYVENNPINMIDPTGLAPHEWSLNTESGEMTKISDLGGDEVQFVHFDKPHENGGMINSGGTAIIEGSNLFSGPVAKTYDDNFTYGVSKVDLWSNVPEDYLGHYNAFDLANRYKYSKKEGENGLRMSSIKHQESMGIDRRDMIWNMSDYKRKMINKYGTDASFVMAAEEGMIPLPAGSIAGLANYSSRSLTLGKSVFFKSTQGVKGSTFFKNISITPSKNLTKKITPNSSGMDDFLRNSNLGMGGM